MDRAKQPLLSLVSAALVAAVGRIPAGRWAVGVSGGADSVALLSLLRSRPQLLPHVVHLDHQTRGVESTADAAFVGDLARAWGMPCTITRLRDVEPALKSPPSNASARYRAARLSLFSRVAREQALMGVLLAHHADDQAETVLHRLLRNGSPIGLAGMAYDGQIAGLRVVRPLLAVRAKALRVYLRESGQAWREDASNASDHYFRNRLRRLLAGREELGDDLPRLANSSAALREWARSAAPELQDAFAVSRIIELPALVAKESARRWLVSQGVPADEISAHVLRRFLAMARDAATSSRAHFPGRVLVRRRKGIISASR